MARDTAESEPTFANPELAAKVSEIWDGYGKYRIWLRVELELARAWAKAGLFPQSVADEMWRCASFKAEDIDRYEAETHHDLIAFTKSVADSLSPATARWFHFGVTSSDIVDTATSLQMVETLRLLTRTLRDEYERPDWWDGEDPGHKLVVNKLNRLAMRVSVGQLSGPVGTHATVPTEIEEEVMYRLQLKPDGASSQVISRDRHAEYVTTLAWLATILARKHGGRAAREQALIARGYATTALESIALWHERDISHSSVERIVLPGVSLTVAHILGVGAEPRESEKVTVANPWRRV